MPDKIIPEELNNLEIIDKKEDNWGQKKGGNTGKEKKIAYLKTIWHDKRFSKARQKSGKKAIERLQKVYGSNLTKMAILGKMRKRENISKKLDLENVDFFTNKKINLDSSTITLSKNDRKKHMLFPKEITPELAEEIGVHLGDGCLSFNRKYFSVKTNKKEKDYMINFLFPLYKKLYNLDLKLMELKSVVGFEIYSKALFDFKNKVIGIPCGEKVERIEVPRVILDTKNREVYYAFIRGLFDTDGCVYIAPSKNNYPIITFTIKSRKLIEKVKEMLLKLGFIPSIYRWTININGPVMLKKWTREISSHNSKNIKKLTLANNLIENR